MESERTQSLDQIHYYFSRFSGILENCRWLCHNSKFRPYPLRLDHSRAFLPNAKSQHQHHLAQGSLWLLELPTATWKCWGLISPRSSPQVITEVIVLRCSPAFPQGAKLQLSSSLVHFVGFLPVSLAHMLTLPPFHLHLGTTYGFTRILAKRLLLGKP